MTGDGSGARRPRRIDGRRERRHEAAAKLSADVLAAPDASARAAVPAPATSGPAADGATPKPAFRRIAVFGSLDAAA